MQQISVARDMGGCLVIYIAALLLVCTSASNNVLCGTAVARQQKLLGGTTFAPLDVPLSAFNEPVKQGPDDPDFGSEPMSESDRKLLYKDLCTDLGTADTEVEGFMARGTLSEAWNRRGDSTPRTDATTIEKQASACERRLFLLGKTITDVATLPIPHVWNPDVWHPEWSLDGGHGGCTRLGQSCCAIKGVTQVGLCSSTPECKGEGLDGLYGRPYRILGLQRAPHFAEMTSDEAPENAATDYAAADYRFYANERSAGSVIAVSTSETCSTEGSTRFLLDGLFGPPVPTEWSQDISDRIGKDPKIYVYTGVHGNLDGTLSRDRKSTGGSTEKYEASALTRQDRATVKAVLQPGPRPMPSRQALRQSLGDSEDKDRFEVKDIFINYSPEKWAEWLGRDGVHVLAWCYAELFPLIPQSQDPKKYVYPT